MKTTKIKLPFRVRLRVAKKGFGYVFKNPLNVIAALLAAFVMLGVVLWSLNLDLLAYVLFDAPLSILDKIDFLFDIYGGIVTNYERLPAFLTILFSAVFGINAVLLWTVVRGGRRRALRSGSTVSGGILGILAGGCAACGTSIIGPLVASVFGTVSSATISSLSQLFFLLGIAAVCFSIFQLSIQAATVAAEDSVA